MDILKTMPWDLIALVTYCVISLALLCRCYFRLRKQKGQLNSQRRRIHALEDDVRSLYDSGTTLGNKLQYLEKGCRVLKEQQEKLSLKAPDQQTYRNAIQAIHNGESPKHVADSSGLSRGEVELLTLLQKINRNEPEKKTTSSTEN